MPRFCANISLLWPQQTFAERFSCAARAGFEAVEFQFPYAHDAHELRRLLTQHRLRAVLHNLPAGDWNAGERGIACLPDRVAEFREGVARGIHYARVLGVARLNCLAGRALTRVEPAEQHATLVSNLRYAAAALSDAGLGLLIEPINTFDVPAFVLPRVAEAAALLREVGADNAALQLDVYHAHRMGDDVHVVWRTHGARVGHVQIADAPGRHEPGSGVIDFAGFFADLDRAAYPGWVGCEYLPQGDTDEGLEWLRRLRQGQERAARSESGRP